MSKASKQTLALLAVATGAMIMIENDDSIMPTVLYSRETLENCVHVFPATHNEVLGAKWMHEKLAAWQDRVNELEGNWTAIILVSIAHQIVNDPCERIRAPHKLELLQPAEEALAGLSDQIDPAGDQYAAYEKADELLKDLYRRIGF